MNELRVALIILGAVFLAVLLLWERRRATRKVRPLPPVETAQPAMPATSRSRRLEPSIDDFTAGEADHPDSLQVPTIHPVDPVRVEVMREVAVDVPGAVSMQPVGPAQAAEQGEADAPVENIAEPAPVATPVAIRWPPPVTERVLSVRVVRADGQALAGRALRLAMESAGMVHGPQRIFHLVDEQGWVRASAANMVRPGSFDPALMDAQELRGLSLFCILPGPVAADGMLDGLLELAHAIAGRVGAVVQDEQGAVLAGERLAQRRHSLAPPPDDRE